MSLDFLLPEEDRPKEGFVLMDFSQIIMAAAFTEFGEANKFPKVTVPMMRHLVLQSMRKNKMMFKKQGYEHLIVCVDNSKSGYWRRQEAHYYKKNRALDREESMFDWPGLFEALHTVVDELEKYMPYVVMNIDTIEADDHIAILAQYLTLLGHPVVVCSSDGDFTQLHKLPNLKQWAPMFKKWVKSKTGSPLLDCVTKVVKGDKKDNVASIKVRGDFWLTKVEGERTPPTKQKELEDIAEHYYDLEKIETLLTPVQFERFKENRILIDMDFIRPDIKALIMERYNTYKKAPRSRIYSYFVKSGLSKLMNNLNDF